MGKNELMICCESQRAFGNGVIRSAKKCKKRGRRGENLLYSVPERYNLVEFRPHTAAARNKRCPEARTYLGPAYFTCPLFRLSYFWLRKFVRQVQHVPIMQHSIAKLPNGKLGFVKRRQATEPRKCEVSG